MGESTKGKRNLPAELIMFEKMGDLHRYLLFGRVEVGRGDMEIISPRRISVPFSFLEEKQFVISRKEDGSWSFSNLSGKESIFVRDNMPAPESGEMLQDSYSGDGMHSLGQERALKNGDVICLSQNPVCKAVFLENRRGNIQWESVLMDTGNHVVRITDATDEGKAEDQVDYLTLGYSTGAWEIQAIHSERVFVNGERIRAPFRIAVDDIIQVDETLFVFEGERLIYGYPVRLNGRLAVHIDERAVHEKFRKKVLLRDIDLSVPMGSMVLILGGSGAGKSTFINAVTGYEKAKAKITEGGFDYYRQYDQVKYRIGLVPQQDLMRGEDTVYGTLMNAAQMRLSADLRDSDRQRRVLQVLQTFGLEDLKNEQVAKLSGGQRKRLSIGVEYICLPTLFILDEPDSGLDGVMARELMENLKLIAVQGRIVMVISHTPDRVSDLFDRVIVLAKGKSDRSGQLAFYGDPDAAREFFKVGTMEGIVRRISPEAEGGDGLADDCIQKFREYRRALETPESGDGNRASLTETADVSKTVLQPEPETDEAGIASGKKSSGSKEAVSDGIACAPDVPEDTDSIPDVPEDTGRAFGGWTDNPEQPEVSETAKAVRHTGRAGQVKIYLGKLFRLFLYEKDWKVLPMAALIAMVVTFVLGVNTFLIMEDTAKGALILSCVCVWNGFFNSVQSVCKERPILKREHRSGLHMSSYIAANMIYQAFLCLMQVLICMAIYYLRGVKMTGTGIMTGSFTLDIFITLFLITYASDMLALLLSCIVHTTTTAMTVMPFLLIVELVFSGTFFALPPRIEAVSSFTVSRWGINAICSVSDYNSLPSTVIYRAVRTFRDTDEVRPIYEMLKENPDARHKLNAYAGQHQQKPAYEYSTRNIGRDWLILVAMSAACAALGTLFLEFIDRDRR